MSISQIVKLFLYASCWILPCSLSINGAIPWETERTGIRTSSFLETPAEERNFDSNFSIYSSLRDGDAPPDSSEILYRGAVVKIPTLSNGVGKIPGLSGGMGKISNLSNGLGGGSSALRIWGSVYWDKTDLDLKNDLEIESDFFGLMVGIESKRRSGAIWGIYYHYGDEDMSWNQPGFNGSVDHHLLGITYHRSLSLFHFLLNANGGINKFDFREEDFGSADPEGFQGSLYGEFGFGIPVGIIGFKPFWGLHYHFFDHDELYFEQQNFLLYDSEDMHGLNNLLGMRINIIMLNGVLNGQVRGTWVHEFLDVSDSTLNYFGSVVGQSTPVRWRPGDKTGRDWMWFGAGVKLSLGDHLKCFFDYDAMLNSRQTTHTGSINLCIGW